MAGRTDKYKELFWNAGVAFTVHQNGTILGTFNTKDDGEQFKIHGKLPQPDEHPI